MPTQTIFSKYFKLLLAASLLASLPNPIMAQENEATMRAQSAGYKAVFTCGGTFNGGKNLGQIAAHELTGIAPDYKKYLTDLPAAIIDHENKRVSVHYSETMPPRISQWRPHLGCVALPVGALESAAEHVPTIEINTEGLDIDTDNGLPWSKRAPVGASSGNAAIDDAVKAIFKKGNYGADQFTTAILIATPTEIIAEHYIDGYTPTTSQRTWSVAKSIAASTLGVVVHKGIIDVKAPAGLKSWSKPTDPRGAITLENLLHMASGLDSNVAGNRTDRVYFGGGLVSDTSTRTGLEAIPGSRWKYANSDTMLAVRTLREHMPDRDSYMRFPFEELLYKIGMTHTKLETDWDGNFILSSQVWTTARDMARLGVLHLQDGVWNGERILAEGWVKYVATPAPAQPASRNIGYGAQWWLYNKHYPGLPNDTFAARGNRGQVIMVIPSKNLVIVRRGYDPSGGQGIQLHEFAVDILKALEAE